jgi:hypothetical protein
MAMPHLGQVILGTISGYHRPCCRALKNTIHSPHNPYFIKTLVLGLYRNFGTPSSLVFRPHSWIKPWSLGHAITTRVKCRVLPWIRLQNTKKNVSRCTRADFSYYIGQCHGSMALPSHCLTYTVGPLPFWHKLNCFSFC